ncbi:CbiX/SirB N-terminal domain-containing protein [Micromonospora sp. WMMD558]|uniref:(2Fe-2S) ferredoxin domain-containing protein n=1 Tax=unclassified Micromonospora TaxID=2617518 RepID=UPI0012B442B4|nr:(2Fe-2S) ferredoxin domain-containing protein [Micromonospora sp. WMMC415]QGN49687.1 (2Fe-2S) ferredoxin domain-containing protein [Micromonospora sp. WMMC415]
MTRHVLLVARAVTHTAGHDTVHRLAADLRPALGAPVSACFLDGARPSLHDALDAAVTDGASDIVLVPTHLPPDRYLDTWIRRAHAHWTAGHDQPPPVSVTAPLALQPALVTAVAEAIAGPHQPLTGTPGPFRSAAWSTVPRHRHHVLVCRGPRCTAYGANEVADALTRRLDAYDLGDDDVLVTATGCLFPCDLGPLVVVHPDDIWYPHVDTTLARRIADDHLRAGCPVDGRPARSSA